MGREGRPGLSRRVSGLMWVWMGLGQLLHSNAEEGAALVSMPFPRRLARGTGLRDKCSQVI